MNKYFLNTDAKKSEAGKKMFVLGMFFLIGIFLFSVFYVSAVGEVSYCCEKTRAQSDGSGGACCQNAPESECDQNYRKVPTSCEATSYCRLGICVNTLDGICMENTPESV